MMFTRIISVLALSLSAILCPTMQAEETERELTFEGEVPSISIHTDGGAPITSKTVWVKGTVEVNGQGVFDDFSDSLYIRGRGNSTWYAAKKPYRLKFVHKQKPFGLKKSRHFVLLANEMDTTLMLNAMAFKTARLIGSAYAGHGIPVELYLNDDYCGSYLFTEQIRIGYGSVDIDEEKGVLLELDVNYDNPQQFISNTYYLPVMVHNPEEASDSLSAAIRNRWNEMEVAIQAGTGIDTFIDIDALSRYMLVYDLFCNNETGHPKSVFCSYLRTANGDTPLVFGPVWDFDWSCGYLGIEYFGMNTFVAPFEQVGFSTKVVTNYGPSKLNGYPFFSRLAEIPDVKEAFKQVWKEFLDGPYQALLTYIDHYETYAAPSFDHDAALWGNSLNHHAATMRFRAWLQERVRLRCEEWGWNLMSVDNPTTDELPIISIIYYAPSGQSSATPFSGLNIIRKVHDDGSITIEKIVL